MGSKRIGLARMQALIENLKRELNLEGTTLKFPVVEPIKNMVVRSATTAHDLTATSKDLTVVYSGTQAGAITLPQATADNVGMVIKIMFGATASTTVFKLGFADGGSTVLVGRLTLGALDAANGDENIGFAITSNAKSLEIDADEPTKAGGAVGSTYTFTYVAADTVFCEGHGMITTGTPALAAAASTTTGT